MSAVLVNGAGVGLIALIIGWFWFAKPKPRGRLVVK